VFLLYGLQFRVLSTFGSCESKLEDGNRASFAGTGLVDSLGRAPDSQLSQGVQNRDIGDMSDSRSAPRPQPGILKHHVSASGSLSLLSHYRATDAKALS